MNRAEQQPIFLNCFSRGGSNLLWNVFLSHPEVCSPIEETLQIFRFDWRAPRLAGFRAALLSGQPRFFDQWKLAPRRNISRPAARFIDRTLHEWKMKTVSDPEMRFKGPETPYTEAEVAASRLVAKNNNGLVFLARELRKIYPDAVFVNLVRDPAALYEGHKRRGLCRSPEQFSRYYRTIATEMLRLEREGSAPVTLRLESLLQTPREVIPSLYRAVGLDPEAVPLLRFKAKRHLQPDGSYRSSLELDRHHWLTWRDAAEFLRPEVNQLQVDRLDPAERSRLENALGSLPGELGWRHGE